MLLQISRVDIGLRGRHVDIILLIIYTLLYLNYFSGNRRQHLPSAGHQQAETLMHCISPIFIKNFQNGSKRSNYIPTYDLSSSVFLLLPLEGYHQ